MHACKDSPVYNEYPSVPQLYLTFLILVYNQARFLETSILYSTLPWTSSPLSLTDEAHYHLTPNVLASLLETPPSGSAHDGDLLKAKV